MAVQKAWGCTNNMQKNIGNITLECLWLCPITLNGEILHISDYIIS